MRPFSTAATSRRSARAAGARCWTSSTPCCAAARPTEESTMKLYLAPGACSLADHIALHEAGLEFDRITVDIPTRRTESGADFTKVNPKGYVPALVLDDGTVLTEN